MNHPSGKILEKCSLSRVLLPFTASVAMIVAVASGATALADEHKNGTEADIVDVAVEAGDFATLAAALQAAGLVDTLKGEGPYTVFAPTDAAFAKLPEGTVDSLLMPENREKLVSILTYHVVSGKVMAADVVELSNATTLNGSDIDISVSDGNVRVDDANVVQTDIGASNGVIHVIDSVIMPN